jgi:hypothetical protein
MQSYPSTVLSWYSLPWYSSTMEQSCPGTVLPWNILTLVQSCPDSPTWFSFTLVHSSLARPGLVQSNTGTFFPGTAWLGTFQHCHSSTLVQSYPGTVPPWYSLTLVHSSMVQSVQSLSYHGTWLPWYNPTLLWKVEAKSVKIFPFSERKKMSDV